MFKGNRSLADTGRVCEVYSYMRGLGPWTAALSSLTVEGLRQIG